MNRFIRIALAVLLLASSPVHAGAGVDSLNAFFTQAKSLRADFIQYRTDQSGKVLQESKGVLLIQRPGKVRLEYSLPYKQLYIANGERIWAYDPELEQVIVKKMNGTLGDTPILLLSGHSDLNKTFYIQELEPKDKEKQSLDWVELTPRVSDSTFIKVRIAFTRSARELRIMELQDALGYSTFMEFHNVERNLTHAYNAFTFTPPAGVDVISDEPEQP